MQTAANLTAQPKTTSSAKGKSNGISWPEFQRKYLTREDGYKYEWVNNEVVKSKHMDYTQFYIVKNLLSLFRDLVIKRGLKGELLSEGDMLFGDFHRRPDMFYLTDNQIVRTSYGENQVPLFVVEVISTKDQMNLVHEKMQNYREAEVQIVWHIFPKINQVHVYSGDGLKVMLVCLGDDVCSATSVIADFEMTANAIFEKQPKP
jgi:Uma2 family endonuclease